MNRFALKWHHNLPKCQGFVRALSGQNPKGSCKKRVQNTKSVKRENAPFIGSFMNE